MINTNDCMSNESFHDRYFKWLCEKVCGNKRYLKDKSWMRLLTHLNRIPFMWVMSMDRNRAQDGLDLQYHYVYETTHRIPSKGPSASPNHTCSMLEMLVALAMRCENELMASTEYTNRTGKWFWLMIYNLGLSEMHDDLFDEDYVDCIVERFLGRDYESNGEGGLFIVPNSDIDMRDVDIWYQMMLYMKNIV